MKIELLETAGWYTVFKNLRQSYSLDNRSEISTKYINITNNNIDYGVNININDKDLQLLSTLVKKGDSHSKIIRGLQTYVEITAPRYWWQEWITYVIGVLEINPTIDWVSLNSESTMHTIKKGVTDKDFTSEVTGNNKEEIKRIIHWNNNIEYIKANLPEGYLQTRTFQVSYQAWRRIYQQRYNHKLEEWNENIIEFIESLPFAEQLITIKGD
jgi:hypothetical protein